MYKTNVLYWPFLLLMDLLGHVFVAPFLKFRKITNVRKILVIRTEEIGDVVLTTPFFRELKKNMGRVEIHVLCKEPTRDLLELNPYVDRVQICEKSWLDKRNFGYFLSLIKKLRKEKYDVVFDPHPDPQSILLAFFTGRYALGFGYRGFGFLLTRALGWKRVHIIKQNLALLKFLGIHAKSERTEFYFEKKDEQKVELLLKNFNISTFICVHPGTRRMEKRWPISNWVGLCNQLLKRGETVILTGSEDEQGYNDTIVNDVTEKASIINMAGKTSLTELGCLIRKSTLFIGPDTGALHIARAFDIPLIGLFGSEDALVWGYNEEKYRSLPAKKMDSITVDAVLQHVEEVLE